MMAVSSELKIPEAFGLPAAHIDAIKTPGYLFAERVPSPRFLKTHLALSLLPPAVLDSSKMVYVARDPKDVAVSLYYHNQRFKAHGYVGDFKTYWDLYRKNFTPWAPFWAHVKEAWAQRHHPNMLFMFYEEMISDLPAAVRKVSTFFGKEYSDDQIKTLCDHLDFKNFKNNKSVNFESLNNVAFVNKNTVDFVRKGILCKQRSGLKLYNFIRNMCSSVKVTELPKETDELLRRLFKGHGEGLLQFGEARYLLPSNYRAHADAMRAMTPRPDDVWVASFPRCGTTWTQELVWLLNNDLDYKKAAEIYLSQRYFFIELFSILHELLHQLSQLENSGLPAAHIDALKTPGYIFVERVPSPRFLKTHLALSLLPPAVLDSSKMVYIARDPRDVAVSFYYHNQRFKAHGYVGDFKTYWDLYRKNFIPSAPFWAHVKEAWAQRNHPNMLFIFYEEMILDLPAAVRKVSTFFGKEYSDDQMKTLCDHLDFKNFKNNKSVNFESLNNVAVVNKDTEDFIRKGKVGDWRGHFDEEMTRQAQEWMQHHLRDTDLRFPQA